MAARSSSRIPPSSRATTRPASSACAMRNTCSSRVSTGCEAEIVEREEIDQPMWDFPCQFSKSKKTEPRNFCKNYGVVSNFEGEISIAQRFFHLASLPGIGKQITNNRRSTFLQLWQVDRRRAGDRRGAGDERSARTATRQKRTFSLLCHCSLSQVALYCIRNLGNRRP